MSNDISTVAVVFRDLSDAFDELSIQKLSPLKVRATFSSFLGLSYKLTQVMCKEYYRRTGGKWEANNFNGWDKVSAFFTRLRTIDTHEHPVLIQVYERGFYGIAEDSTNTLVLEWTWSLGDPHWTCVGSVDCSRLRTVRGKESSATNKPGLPPGVSPRSYPAG